MTQMEIGISEFISNVRAIFRQLVSTKYKVRQDTKLALALDEVE
jgi:hypothetical protein